MQIPNEQVDHDIDKFNKIPTSTPNPHSLLLTQSYKPSMHILVNADANSYSDNNNKIYY